MTTDDPPAGGKGPELPAFPPVPEKSATGAPPAVAPAPAAPELSAPAPAERRVLPVRALSPGRATLPGLAGLDESGLIAPGATRVAAPVPTVTPALAAADQAPSSGLASSAHGLTAPSDPEPLPDALQPTVLLEPLPLPAAGASPWDPVIGTKSSAPPPAGARVKVAAAFAFARRALPKRRRAADGGTPAEPDGAPGAGEASGGSRHEQTTMPDAGPASGKGEPAHLQSWVVMLLCAASLVMVLWNMQTRSIENANTGSRYATIDSLVERGTYDIDGSRYARTPDKVKARGHFVSSKPPLLPTYGAGIYWVIKKVTGYDINDHEGVVVWTVGVFTGWLSHLLFLVYFYRLCGLLLRRQLAILVTVACGAFAYLGAAYATAINNHSIGGALQVMGFYYAYRARNEAPSRPKHWLLSGLWLGLLPAFDLPSLGFSAFSWLYLLTKNWKWTLLLVTPVMLPCLALEPMLAHIATGSWLPAYSDKNLTNYAGNYFKQHASGIDALKEPKSLYAFHMLFGHHGLFSMTPLYLFGLFESVRRFVKREPYRLEIAVWMTTLFAFLFFYIRGTTNYGGWCVGMRWLVPVMPWLMLLFGLWFDRTRLTRVKRMAVLFAFLVSAYNVQDGLSSPFQFSVWHNFLDGAPNRSRLGPTWNLGKASAAKKKSPAKKAAPKKPPSGPALPGQAAPPVAPAPHVTPAPASPVAPAKR